VKRFFSIFIGLLLVASTAGATDFQTYTFSQEQGGVSSQKLAFNSPFTSTLEVLAPPKATGSGTFTRASSQIIPDHEGVLRTVQSGSVAIPGSRVVTNFFLNSGATATQNITLSVRTLYAMDHRSRRYNFICGYCCRFWLRSSYTGQSQRHYNNLSRHSRVHKDWGCLNGTG
jgi:hypothetical protein